MSQKVTGGVAHDLPSDLTTALLASPKALTAWESISPLARNEWICWTISVKTADTRANHVARTISELTEGKRRPCCWIGCTHRTDKQPSASQKWVLSRQSASK